MDTKQYLVEKGAGKGQFNLIVPLPSIVESTYIHVIMCVHDMYDASYTFTFTTCTHVHTTLLDSKNCLTIIVLVLKKFFIFILYTITTVYYYTSLAYCTQFHRLHVPFFNFFKYLFICGHICIYTWYM